MELKEAIKSLLHNLHVGSHNKREVDRAVDNIVAAAGEGGGGSDDDKNAALIEISSKYIGNKLYRVFTLKQGKLSSNSGFLVAGYITDNLNTLVTADITSYNISVCYMFINATGLQINYTYNQDTLLTIDDWLNLKVGDSINILDSEFYSGYKGYFLASFEINASTKKINSLFGTSSYNTLPYVKFYIKENNIKYFCDVVGINSTDKYFLIKVEDEIWKYSFVANGNIISQFNFVEVVQP